MSEVGKRKLCFAQVCRIRVLRKQGYLMTTLSEIFGVHKCTISRIVNGVYWK